MTGWVRFGRFEFDLRSHDLRKEGHPVRLAPQPLRVLSILVSRPGTLITREEIQDQIWPEEPSRVTREQGLNACIARIREALGDHAKSPVYVETHPKRGYRFIAPVDVPGGRTSGAAHEADERVAPADSRGSRSTHRRRLLVAAVAILSALGGALALDSVPFHRSEGRPHARSPVRLAVLPLEHRAEGAGQEAVAAAIAAELAMRLAELAPDRLSVIAYASSAAASRGGASLSRMARALDVDYFLEGQVVETNEAATISMQLIRAEDLSYVWDAGLRHEFVGFEALARAVSERLGNALRLTDAATEPATGTKGEPRPEVRLAYLTAGRLLGAQTREGARRSLPYLAEVVREDPGFARGRARYAGALFWAGERDRAEREALRALELDPSLAEPHRLLADVRLDRDFDWKAAERHYLRAIELGRGRHEFPHAYAHFLVSRGRAQEALEVLERALELNPLSPVLRSDVGWVEYWAGEYARAARQCTASVPLLPLEIRPRAQRCALHALARLGRQEDARRWALEIMEAARAPAESLDVVRSEPAREGLETYFRWALRAENREVALGSSSAFARARGVADLGCVDEAMTLLEQALETRPRGLTTVAVEPRFAPLHGDPRFSSLLARLGLEGVGESSVGSRLPPRDDRPAHHVFRPGPAGPGASSDDPVTDCEEYRYAIGS